MSLGILTSSLRVLKNLKDTPYARQLSSLVTPRDDDTTDYSHVSRRKTRLELVMLSCAVCGIEFCYAAETALVSPTLLKIGVHVVYMSLVWCISPVLGFLLVPLMGSLSDRCRSRLGRRRPFILLLSVGIALGLVAVPYGKTIGVMLGDIYSVYVPPALGGANVTNSPLGVAAVAIADYAGNVTVGNDEDVTTPYPGDAPTAPPIGNHHTWGILFTIIGVVLLDFSCDACQSPCRAYLVDVCVPEDHGAGLSTFTVMAGLGGSLGYVLGGVDWEQTPLAGSVGDSHSNVVFLMVWCIYVVCAALTLCSVREVPLDRLKFAETLERKNKNKKPHKDGGRKYRKFTNEDSSDDGDGGGGGGTVNYGTHGHPHIELVIVPPEKDPAKDDSDEDTRRSQNGSAMCPPEAAHDVAQPPPVELDPLPAEVALKTYLVSIVRMPRSMAVLCLTNLFSWMSLVSYSLYFTDFVGQTVYGGDPFSPPGSPAHDRYERGVRMGSFAMAFYSISCSIYSLNIEKLVKRFGAKRVYVLSQLVYTVGAATMSLWHNKITVVLLSPCAGVMYATLFTMPYLLIASYHSTDTFDELTGSSRGSKQVRGLGTDIAVVSSMVFLAQFLLSAGMGSIVHATGTPAAIMAVAAGLSLCGAVTATQVLYVDQ